MTLKTWVRCVTGPPPLGRGIRCWHRMGPSNSGAGGLYDSLSRRYRGLIKGWCSGENNGARVPLTRGRMTAVDIPAHC